MPDATAKDQSPLPPTEVDRRVPISDKDRSEIEQLYDAFRRGKAKLVAPNGEARLLPDSLYSFLIELIGLLNEGKSVMIVQHQAKLTTVEAASILWRIAAVCCQLVGKRRDPLPHGRDAPPHVRPRPVPIQGPKGRPSP